MQFTVSAARVRDENGRSGEIFAGLSLMFGRSNAGISVVHDQTGTGMVIEGQRPLPVGTGYGFQARAETGSPGAFSGAARYQGRFGRYELRRDVFGGRGVTSATLTGGIVAIGGGLYPSRPVHESFALVRVPGVEGVRGFASHQEVGRTDADGNLLVPDLQPYYGNVLNISDSDIPLRYSVDGVRMTMAVPYRGGALAVFPVQMVRRVTGTIRIVERGQPRIPEYGELTVTASGAPDPIGSPVGGNGDFYLEDVPDGRHRAVVIDNKGSCSLMLEVPPSGDAVIDLGAIECTTMEGR
jgi:outer membrane usher protein